MESVVRERPQQVERVREQASLLERVSQEVVRPQGDWQEHLEKLRRFHSPTTLVSKRKAAKAWRYKMKRLYASIDRS